MHSLIAFCGLKESGKTTAAEWLVRNYGYRRESFATPLKRAAQIIFNLSDWQIYNIEGKETIDTRWGTTPRDLLQRFGTEVGREFDKDIWIRNLMIRCASTDAIVIDDCRFSNETKAIKDMGGLVIGIKRSSCTIDNHASELEMLSNWDSMVDVTIENDGDIPQLYQTLIEVLGCPAPPS